MTAYLEQQLETVRAHLEKMERRVRQMEQQDVVVPDIRIAQTGGSGVPAISGATPGSATVTLFRVNSSGALVSTGITKTAYNLASTAVAANTYVQLKQERGSGKLLIDFEDCG